MAETKRTRAKVPKKAEAQEQPMSYEEGIATLEMLASRMEDGALTLEEMLATYEQGMVLHDVLAALLTQGQRRIEVLRVRDGVPDPAEPPIPFEEPDAPEEDI